MAWRYRDWIRPWNWSMRRWAGVLLGVMVASPFLTRWYCLWQVPDVALPFDEAAFLRYEDVAPEDDAFITYLAAFQMHATNRSIWLTQGNSNVDVWDAVRQAVATPDRPLDSKLVQWLNDNSKTLTLFQTGSTKSFSKSVTLRTLDNESALPHHNGIRQLAFLAQLKGLHCEQSGDFESALQWHRLNLQCARHAETPKIDVCRLIGMATRTNAWDGIAHWAECPFVTPSQIRAIHEEIQSESSRRTKQSDCAIGQYLVCRNTLQRKDAANYLFPAWSTGLTADPVWLPVKRLILWTVGQPEITLRLERQLLVNNWNSINLPLDKRPKALDCPGSIVFETREKRVSGQLEASRLAKIVHNPAQLRMSSRYFDEAIRREDSRLAAMTILLACQEYFRDRGEFPSQLNQLVPAYLGQIPCDPMLATAVPMSYRREADGNAIVWSVGPDGVDDGGNIIHSGAQMKDEGRRIVAPVAVPSALTPSNVIAVP